MTTYPTWPVGVPQVPLVDSLQVPDLYLDPRATDMEGGNVRLRTRPGDGIYMVTFNLLMTRAQWAILKAWILVDLGRGTSRFNTQIWDDASDAMIPVLCQMGAKPTYSSMTPKVLISLTLKVFPDE